jgi:hypothetical protein
VILPVALIILAILSASVVAYGTEPAWAQYPHGVEFIMLARRLEWPLVSLSILLSIALIALVVAGKRRAWFLIGLGPVLALFGHRFASQPMGSGIEEDPSFTQPVDARVSDDDYVVGLSFGDNDYAYPYAALFWRPVVLQTDHDQRMLLIWSAYANRAVAFSISHDLKARDLEIVSSPANALLLYNGRLGQFINGVTGQTSRGQKPEGFLSPIATWKMPWRQWLALHPATVVMSLPPDSPAHSPTTPILPAYPLPPTAWDRPPDTPIAILGSARPAAIESAAIDARPFNLDVDGVPIFVVRPSSGDAAAAFDRRLPDDLRPRFDSFTSTRWPTARFIDLDTNSKWSADGAWIDGLKELKGKKLAKVPIDDDLYWGVMKFWYPQLALQSRGKPGPNQNDETRNQNQ